MKEEEKAIWDQHQQKLAQISRDRTKVDNDYEVQMESINSSVSSQPDILKREREFIVNQRKEKLKEIDRREMDEIGRYMQDISEYDLRIKKDEKEIQKSNKESLELDKD